MKFNLSRNITIALIVITALMAGVLIGSISTRNSYRKTLVDRFTDNKINYTLALINGMYVDSVDMDSLTEMVMPLLVEKLDPHSLYIPAQDMGEANETLDGEFDGVGIVFNMATDTVIVLNVISGGPSDKAGIRNGDRVIKINDSIVAGRKIEQNKIVKQLRGKRGTTVNLGIERSGIKELVPFTVERGIIPIKSIDAAFMITPKTGFIKLSAFSRNSYTEFSKALASLKEQGMESLIFDLRGNTGGFLDQAIMITNEFLPANSLIVYTEDRLRKQVKDYSDGRGKFQDIKLAVMIDEGSASSSEILAGAIQDNDRGVVIGRRSFGKGLVQQQIPFGDGSAIRLTIARYYTPTGRSIQKPYSGGKDAYAMDLVNRYNHNELFSADSIKFADSLKFTTPKGKIVYGGGGIMPDIFIPMDTSDVTRYFVEVSGRNILYKYTIDFTDKHREQINAIKTVPQLQAFFGRYPNLLNDFVAYAAQKGVAPDWTQINKSKALMLAQIKAYVGRNTQLEDVGFFANISAIDNVVKRSIKELSKN